MKSDILTRLLPTDRKDRLTSKRSSIWKTLCSTGIGKKPSEASTLPAPDNEKSFIFAEPEWGEGYKEWLDERSEEQ